MSKLSGMMQIVMVDNISPAIRWIIENKPDWTRKALRSTAWYVQQEVRAGIKSGAPGGLKYAALMNTGRRSQLEAARSGGKKRRGRDSILRNLYGAVAYKYEEQNAAQQVRIGWLSDWAMLVGGWMEHGKNETVKAKMRRLFLAAGIGMKPETASIHIPARPTYAPMFQVLRDKIPVYFTSKFVEYIKNGGPPVKQGRK
ncbi:MAG: hypothetical protein AB9917_02185 [Negativicutes bacterium]